MTQKPVAFYVLHTDQTATRLSMAEVEPHLVKHEETGWEVAYAFIRKHLGCRLVERVDLGEFGEMFVDEEGLFVEVPTQNAVASFIAGQPLVGEVFLVVALDAPEALAGLDSLVRDSDTEGTN